MCSVIQDHFDVSEQQLSIFVTPLFDMHDGRLTGRGCFEFFHPVKGDFNRLPAFMCQKNGYMFVRIGIQLAAKRTTNNGFDYPGPFVFKAHGFQGIQEILLSQGRNLRVGVYGQVVIGIKECNCTAGPHAAMGDPGGGKPVFNHKGGFFLGLFHVSVMKFPWQFEYI